MKHKEISILLVIALIASITPTSAIENNPNNLIESNDINSQYNSEDIFQKHSINDFEIYKKQQNNVSIEETAEEFEEDTEPYIGTKLNIARNIATVILLIAIIIMAIYYYKYTMDLNTINKEYEPIEEQRRAVEQPWIEAQQLYFDAGDGYRPSADDPDIERIRAFDRNHHYVPPYGAIVPTLMGVICEWVPDTYIILQEVLQERSNLMHAVFWATMDDAMIWDNLKNGVTQKMNRLKIAMILTFIVVVLLNMDRFMPSKYLAKKNVHKHFLTIEKRQ